MDRRLRPVALSLIAAAAALVAEAASAHAPAGADSPAGTAVLGAAMAIALLLYLRGLAALWRAAGSGRGVSPRSAGCFIAGWLVLAASLFGPVDAWSTRLFSVHMIQHELLMLVAAPLFVLGAPLATWSWALRPERRTDAGRVTRAIGRSRAWRFATAPSGAWLVHGIAVWAWHVPAAFGAALSSIIIHDLQHVSFLASALLFWWALLRPRAGRRADGVAVFLLFTTMLHTGALGALLAFSARPWYADYHGYGRLTALEDQQLGGLIMWIPGGAVYLAVALLLCVRALQPAAPRPRSA